MASECFLLQNSVWRNVPIYSVSKKLGRFCKRKNGGFYNWIIWHSQFSVSYSLTQGVLLHTSKKGDFFLSFQNMPTYPKKKVLLGGDLCIDFLDTSSSSECLPLFGGNLGFQI